MEHYDKLRPWTNIESCTCPSVSALLLVDLLTDNPIHCAVCRREVDPERIALTIEETEAISHWFSAASALYRLWLHSGEYETYAKERLLDPAGQVNRQGRALAERLSAKIPTQMWYFHDDQESSPSTCPVCCQPLDTAVAWGLGQCVACYLHF